QGGEPRRRQQRIDAPPLVPALAPSQRLAGAAVGFECKPQIVLDAMAVEYGRLLELASDSELGDFGLVEPGEIEAAVEIHLAGVGPRLAGDDVHHGRLAGSVRTDDGAHLAGLDREREIIQRAE